MVMMGEGPKVLRSLPGMRDVDLLSAVQLGWLDRMEVLLREEQALASIKSYTKGGGPLHVAAEHGQVAAADMLIRQGAELDALSIGDSQATPLHWAANNGAVSTIVFLANQGADLNSRDAKELTPLHYATMEGKEEAVYALVACGADLSAVDHEQDSVLHWAAMKSRVNLIRFFLAQGLDVNAVDMFDQTPLHAASVAGSAQCVQQLLDCGAREDVRDANGFTAYDLAKREPKKRKEALELFKAREAHVTVRGPAWLLRRIFFSKDGDSRVWQRAVLFAIACGNFVYLGWVHPFVSQGTALLFITTQLLMWALWMWVVRRDPGTFRPTATRVQEYESALRRFSSPSISAEEAKHLASRFCHTCRVVRPARVHHSSFTNTCIVDYDHYCDFMVHPIGINNRRQFLLTMALLSCLTSFVTLQVYWLHSPLPSDALFWAAYAVLVLSALFCIQLTLSHITHISRGLTMAEAVQRKYPKGSPYDRGVVRNWVLFCGTRPTPDAPRRASAAALIAGAKAV